MGKVNIDLNIYSPSRIAELVGIDPEIVPISYARGTLTVPGVSNAELHAAVSTYTAKSRTYRISKLTLVDRLVAAGLFDSAMTLLRANDLNYERWNAAQSVDISNASVRTLLTAIGGDLDVLLAPETE